MSAPRTRTGPVLGLGLAVIALLAGCSQKSVGSNDPNPSGSGTTSVSAPATVSSSAPAATTPASVPASTTVAAGPPSLGGSCDDLLPVTTIDKAVGQPVVGDTNFVVGVAEPNIGRLLYLNCRYGIGKKVKGKPAPSPLIEVGVSLYDSATQATTRAEGTVDDYRSNGAAPTPATIGAVPATILVGYGAPTIVLSDGPRTVAISISKGFTPDAQPQTLIALATTALAATADYSGVTGSAPASAAATPPASASGPATTPPAAATVPPATTSAAASPTAAPSS